MMSELTVLKNAFDAGFFEGCPSLTFFEERARGLLGEGVYDRLVRKRETGYSMWSASPYFRVCIGDFFDAEIIFEQHLDSTGKVFLFCETFPPPVSQTCP